MRKNPIFVIQKHDATRLHWDLRLEMDGVLRSWAVPKEPPCVKGVKRLAVEVPDHDISYAQFEGTIKEGEYGAGSVSIWDTGTYFLEKKENDELVFTLNGRKLTGSYCLIKIKSKKQKRKNWLLFKKNSVRK